MEYKDVTAITEKIPPEKKLKIGESSTVRIAHTSLYFTVTRGKQNKFIFSLEIEQETKDRLGLT